MNTQTKETHDYRMQLQRLLKDLNSKERNSNKEVKLIFGKIPQHFVSRLFERIQYTKINYVITEMIKYIIKHRDTIIKKTTAIKSEYIIRIDSYCYIVIEINYGGRCQGSENDTVMLNLKTIVKYD